MRDAPGYRGGMLLYQWDRMVEEARAEERRRRRERRWESFFEQWCPAFFVLGALAMLALFLTGAWHS